MVATDVYLDDAYATYWHTVEADLDDPAPVAVFDLEDDWNADTPQEVLDAYAEFSTMSED
ncbi:hypothetical protein BH11PLA2_BH11PLA2_03410 [soil metagenome]